MSKKSKKLMIIVASLALVLVFILAYKSLNHMQIKVANTPITPTPMMAQKAQASIDLTVGSMVSCQIPEYL